MWDGILYILYAMWILISWSIIYAISYTTKLWLILWIFIGLSIMSDIIYYTGDNPSFNIIYFITSLGIRGMFLYISYNLYKNPTESYSFVKVVNNSNKTKTKE